MVLNVSLGWGVFDNWGIRARRMLGFAACVIHVKHSETAFNSSLCVRIAISNSPCISLEDVASFLKFFYNLFAQVGGGDLQGW